MPAQLLTKEFNDEVAGVLADGGVYLMHLSDSYHTGRLLGTVVNTLRETFPHVYVIASRAGLSSPRGTFVRSGDDTACSTPQAILAEHVKHLDFSLLDDTQINDLKERCGSVILTDDYAPVESLLAPVVRHAAPEIPGTQVLRPGERASEQTMLRAEHRSGIVRP